MITEKELLDTFCFKSLENYNVSIIGKRYHGWITAKFSGNQAVQCPYNERQIIFLVTHGLTIPVDVNNNSHENWIYIKTQDGSPVEVKELSK